MENHQVFCLRRYKKFVKKLKNMTEKYYIDKEAIQAEAESCLGRSLTEDEIAEVLEAVCDDVWMLIQDKICDVIEFNQLLERNSGAELHFPHFKAYHRNENAYQPEFSQVGCFKTEEDAQAFVHHDFITEFDEWKIFRIDEKEMREIWSINCDRP